jgi:hypothetical protein
MGAGAGPGFDADSDGYPDLVPREFLAGLDAEGRAVAEMRFIATTGTVPSRT